MSGDFSRNSFSPTKDFSLVRMQQGRLFSDADWNEQGDILRDADRNTAADIVGASGFPQDTPGFGLIWDEDTGTFKLSEGTGYVAGVRHVLRAGDEFTLSVAQAAGPNTVWQIVDGMALADGDVIESTVGLHRIRDFDADDEGTRLFQVSPPLPDDTDQVTRVTTLERQPYFSTGGLPEGVGSYLAYLKSFDVSVTALDDPDIREIAFDGPDTATRDQTIWRVHLVAVDDLIAAGFDQSDVSCPALASGFDPVLVASGQGVMQARADIAAIASGPCTLPPASGYRSLENLLYRVAIHIGGSGDTAFYKWSRTNASHRTRYRQIESGALVVDSIGRDEVSALKTEDWIEIRDRAAIWSEAPGFFARIGEVVGTRVSLSEILDPVTLAPLTANGLPDTDALPRAAFVTRWEGGAPQPVSAAIDTWTEIENGVQINFGEGVFQIGDYWSVPARAIAGDVQWPRNPVTGGPLHQHPHGPRRDYAALALVENTGAGWSVGEDCRQIFPPAVKSKQVLYSGGDGQEVMPDPLNPGVRVALPQPLSVAVVQGQKPLSGERIRFDVVLGGGELDGGATQVVETDGSGLANANWSLDAQTPSQQVRAVRVDAADQETHAPILFNATLSQAADVSFDPANTPTLGGTNTVQEAIETLVGLQQIGCTTYIVTPEQDWVAILEGLEEGENASICFARGTYTASRAVQMRNLGHIRLSGAGAGIAEITVDRSEAALAFFGCASVIVSNLSVSAPAGNSGVDDNNKIGRGGTLDFTQCNVVEVLDCTLLCGAGTSTARTCVTSRGWTAELGINRPAQSVKIVRNSLKVGHMQEAVLVTDARDVEVSNNQISVRPRGSQSLSIDAFLKDRVWVASAVNSLVAKAVTADVLTTSPDRAIRSKQWRYEFQSPLSQKTWDDLVEANPPEDGDLTDEQSFADYAGSLVLTAAAEPDRFDELKVQIDGLRRSLGNSARLDDPKVIQSLLVTSQPQTSRFDSRSDKERSVVVEANGEVVAFDSAFSEQDWKRALGRTPGIENVASSSELLGFSRGVAERLLVDPGFRAGLGSVENWFATLANDAPSLMRQGIVVGGRVLDTVRITRNTIRDAQVGVRVAASHLQNQRHEAGFVEISDNAMELLAQGEQFYAGYGVFVGNARSIQIRGNMIALSKRPNFRKFFAQGIRIWGFVGRHLSVERNRISMATMGIRIHHVEEDLSAGYLWVLSQNLIEGPPGTRDFKVTPENPLIAENNRVHSGL